MHPSSSGSLSTSGLQMSLAALQRLDPCIRTIVDLASQVALYTFNSGSCQWEKMEVEGTLFIHSRLTSPRHGFTIMNRLNMQNLTEAITQDLDLQLQEPFLLYRNARLVIHGIWFYDPRDCRRITDMMKLLTRQEQVLVRSQTTDCEVEDGAMVDVVRMLTNAQSQYEKKASSEPKEIRVCEDLRRNLIKPIPVKPSPWDAKTSGFKLTSAAKFSSSAPCSTVAACRPPVAGILPYNSMSAVKPAGPPGPQNQQLDSPAPQKLSQDLFGMLGPHLKSPHLHPPHQSVQPPSVWGPTSRRSGTQTAGLPIGSLSPHDLIQKLQLVQQQQTRSSMGAATSQNQDLIYSGLQAAAQPQRVSSEGLPDPSSDPNQLLSPSVFTQYQSRPSIKVLSRSQLQATLLHLIQSDSSFLDHIYRTYISRTSNVCRSK